MIQTVEAVLDASGSVRRLAPVRGGGPRRPRVTVLDEPAAAPGEAALLAAAARAGRNRPEEDAAWSHLQAGRSCGSPSRSPI